MPPLVQGHRTKTSIIKLILKTVSLSGQRFIWSRTNWVWLQTCWSFKPLARPQAPVLPLQTINQGSKLGTALRFCRLSPRLAHKRLSEQQKSPLCCAVSRYPAQFSGVLVSSCGNQYILCGQKMIHADGRSRANPEPSGHPLLLLKGTYFKVFVLRPAD